jgi:hypothetical protein
MLGNATQGLRRIHYNNVNSRKWTSDLELGMLEVSAGLVLCQQCQEN